MANGISRRSVIKGAAGAAGLLFSSPRAGAARGETVRIGFDGTLTGPYAVAGAAELAGCKHAVEQINAKGGILGRPVELLVEDSTSGDAGTAVQKARKLIERDKVNFLLGNANSALAMAMAQASHQKGVLHIVPGGHTDAITGASCRWNVFRVCNTTQMEANAVASSIIKAGGRKWYYITPDYSFGHTLQAGLEKAAARFGGTKVGGDLTPLGTTDFSSILIKAQAAAPEVIVFLLGGDDMINALKQAVQFGLHKRIRLAGAQQELEQLRALPPEARIGTWVFEWYWRQPGVPHLADFVADIRKKTGSVPSSRTWFGFVSAWSCALAASKAGSLDAVKMAKALEGLTLPPEVGLMPEAPWFRKGDHQLIPSLFVGEAQASGDGPDDLFRVTQVVKGSEVAAPVEETGCKIAWPT